MGLFVSQAIMEYLNELKEGQENIMSGQQEMMDMLKVVMTQTQVGRKILQGSCSKEAWFEDSISLHVHFACGSSFYWFKHVTVFKLLSRTNRRASLKMPTLRPSGARKPSRHSKSSKRWPVARSSSAFRLRPS